MFIANVLHECLLPIVGYKRTFVGTTCGFYNAGLLTMVVYVYLDFFIIKKCLNRWET